MGEVRLLVTERLKAGFGLEPLIQRVPSVSRSEGDSFPRSHSSLCNAHYLTNAVET